MMVFVDVHGRCVVYLQRWKAKKKPNSKVESILEAMDHEIMLLTDFCTKAFIYRDYY